MPPRRTCTRRDWLSAAGAFALSGCVARSSDEPIWIGHVGHVGPAGRRGESAIDGMQQMLADLREKKFAVSGRSLGVRHVEAKDKTRARAEASRLLAVNRVACLIVGPEVEGVAEICAIARAHGSIAVVLAGTDDRALSRQAVWLGVGPETQGEMLARYAIGKGLKKYTSTLKADDELLRGFAREFAKGGKPPESKVGQIHLAPRVNFTTPVEEGEEGGSPQPTFLRRGPGGMPELTVPNAPGGKIWRLRLQPGPADLAAADRVQGDNLLAGLAQALVEAVTLPANGRAWAERYEKRFGRRPDDDAVLGAEAVAFIAEALKAAGGDRAKLAAEIDDRTEFAGLTGPVAWVDWRTRRRMWVSVEKGKSVTTEPVPD